MEKKAQEVKDLLKLVNGARSMEREMMPRPTVFKNKKKYDRKRDKQIKNEETS